MGRKSLAQQIFEEYKKEEPGEERAPSEQDACTRLAGGNMRAPAFMEMLVLLLPDFIDYILA